MRDRLVRYGASKALVERTCAVIEKSGVKGMYALDVAARVLGRAFPAQSSPKRDGRTRILAMVGPSGAGKTTTMAKIGRRINMFQQMQLGGGFHRQTDNNGP